jgi:hypothetical protein
VLRSVFNQFTVTRKLSCLCAFFVTPLATLHMADAETIYEGKVDRSHNPGHIGRGPEQDSANEWLVAAVLYSGTKSGSWLRTQHLTAHSCG